jgi:uncharacterized protein YbjT (DUF2867 family)
MEILVTGGTGTLGRALVARLRADGYLPRVLSRRPGDDGRIVGDLETGAGVPEAVRGVDTIVHAATRFGHDVPAAARLLKAARDADVRHLVFISIVGIDRVPYRYYRDKQRVERLIEDGGVPWTILRATQFHDLLAKLFGALSRSPVLPVLAGAPFQPVDVRDVADRLAALAVAEPAGRVPALAGPQIRPMADLARAWLRATGRHRPVLPVWAPGAFARAVRAGGLVAPSHADGRITFDDYLAARTSMRS